MGTDRGPRHHQGAGPAPRAAVESRPGLALIKKLEAAAPFAAGGILLAGGIASAISKIGVRAIPDLIPSASMTVSLLIAGAGAGIVVAASDMVRKSLLLTRAEQDVLRAQ